MKRKGTANNKPHTVSSLIRHIENELPKDEDIVFGQFLSLLGVHGFVFFMLVLAVLNVAIFMVPGFSIFFGVPMVILAVQMFLGIEAPIFPGFVRERTLKLSILQKGLHIAVEAVEKIEKYIRPRFLILTHPTIIRFHSLIALVLAVMVAIPVPLLNLPPTIGILCLCLGLLQRDGLFVLLSYALALWSFHLYESLGGAAQRLVG